MVKHVSGWIAALAFVGGCGGTDLGAFCENFPERCEFDMAIDGAEEDPANGEIVLSKEARMCTTVDGRVYATWTDDRRGFFRDVWFNRSDDGGRTWFPSPLRITRGSGDASGVSIDCNADRVFIAWEDTRDSETGYANIYVNLSTDGGVNWLQEDIRLDDDPEGRAISSAPQVLFSRGAVHVVWFDQVNGPPDIYAAYSPNLGKAWGPMTRVSGSPEEAGVHWSGNPRIATDGQNRLHVVWEDTRNGTQDIFHSAATKAVTELAKDEVLTFGNQTRLTKGEPRGTTYGFRPSIATSGNKIWVAWHDTRAGDARDIFLNFSGNGGENWLDAAVRVESDDAGLAESFNAVVCAKDEFVTVAWQDARDGGYDIYARTFKNGDPTSGEEEVRLDQDSRGSGNSVDPVLWCNDDLMLVAWEDQRAGGSSGLNDLYYNYCEFDEDGFCDWTNDEYRLDSIADGTKYTEDLNVSYVDGEVYALWTDNRDGNKDLDIYFSFSELGEGVDLYATVLAAEGAAAAGATEAQ